jgi:hypothetical protein
VGSGSTGSEASRWAHPDLIDRIRLKGGIWPDMLVIQPPSVYGARCGKEPGASASSGSRSRSGARDPGPLSSFSYGWEIFELTMQSCRLTMFQARFKDFMVKGGSGSGN